MSSIPLQFPISSSAKQSCTGSSLVISVTYLQPFRFKLSRCFSPTVMRKKTNPKSCAIIYTLVFGVIIQVRVVQCFWRLLSPGQSHWRSNWYSWVQIIYHFSTLRSLKIWNCERWSFQYLLVLLGLFRNLNLQMQEALLEYQAIFWLYLWVYSAYKNITKQ